MTTKVEQRAATNYDGLQCDKPIPHDKETYCEEIKKAFYAGIQYQKNVEWMKYMKNQKLKR